MKSQPEMHSCNAAWTLEKCTLSRNVPKTFHYLEDIVVAVDFNFQLKFLQKNQIQDNTLLQALGPYFTKYINSRYDHLYVQGTLCSLFVFSQQFIKNDI